jgi:uncharacterized delta-60 repeat protein
MKIEYKFRCGFIRFLLINGLVIFALNIIPQNSDSPFCTVTKAQKPTSKVNNEASSVAIQTDGKIVVAGTSRIGTNYDFTVVRYNTDGSLDSSFGNSGTVITDIDANSFDMAKAVAVQSDGKIVAAGWTANGETSFGISKNNFALVRYNANGSPDTSFGQNGKVKTAFDEDSSEIIESIAIQPDGKIVAVGSTHNGRSNDFAIARYKQNGIRDTSFNGTGKIIKPINPAGDLAYSVAVQPDGKIIVAGESYKSLSSEFAVVKYNPDGSSDTSFGENGQLTVQNDKDFAISKAILFQTDGKMIIIGTLMGKSSAVVYGMRVNSGQSLSAARYNAAGSLDNSFGQKGKSVVRLFPNAIFSVTAAVLQTDGKIVVAGSQKNPVNSLTNIVICRLNANGNLDTSFGQGGKDLPKFGSGSEIINAAAMQSDGKIVAVGYAYTGSSLDFAVLRYNPNGSLDTSFDKDGKVTTDITK